MSGAAKALMGFDAREPGTAVHHFPFGYLDHNHATGIATIEAYIALALSLVLGILLWRSPYRD